METIVSANEAESSSEVFIADPLLLWEAPTEEMVWPQSDEAVLRYGLTELDNMLLGLHPGDLIVIAGDAGSGKTSFAESLVYRLARHQEAAGMFFALGRKMRFTLAGLAAISGRIDYDTLLQGGGNTEKRQEKARSIVYHLRQMRLVVCDSSSLSLIDVEERIREAHKSHGIRFAVIDMWQNITNPYLYAYSALCSLKKLARELGVPIVLFTRMTRLGNACLTYNDVIDNGYMDHPDVVVLLHNDEGNSVGELDLEIVKNANGHLGSVRVAFIDSQHRIENLAVCRE